MTLEMIAVLVGYLVPVNERSGRRDRIMAKAAKLVTVKATTVRVSPVGISVTGADTDNASDRLAGLMARNNGKALRDDSERRADKGAVLAGIACLVRTGTPMTLADARKAYRAGTLAHVVAPISAVTTGTTPASANMALDRDARAFGADGFTVRCFAGEGDTLVLYAGKPKG
jgi:hypothetical protein